MIDYLKLRIKSKFIGKYILINDRKVLLNNDLSIKDIKYIYNMVNKEMFYVEVEKQENIKQEIKPKKRVYKSKTKK